MSSAPHWTEIEDALLREHYPTASNAELQALFPTRPLAGIRQRAHQIGTRKNLDAYEGGMPISRSIIGHLSEAEKGYLAGIIDGEGCIMLARHLGKRGKHVYHLYLSIANTSMALHHWLEERLPGTGYVKQHQRADLDTRPGARPDRWKTRYDWIVSGNRVVAVLLREIAPYLVIKCEQAELLAGGYVHLAADERETLYLRLRHLKRQA